MAEMLRNDGAPWRPALTFAEFYEAALQLPEFAVYVIRVDGAGAYSFEAANHALGMLAGKSVAEIRGRQVHEVLLPQIANCLIGNLGTVIETGRPLAYHRTLDLPDGRVSFKTRLVPVARGSDPIQFVVGLTRDVTQENDAAEETQHQLRDMSTRMLTLQNDERQRIAQELHDSTGQHLYAAALALHNARALHSSAPAEEAGDSVISALVDAANCVHEAQREIRVLSFLLHPPHLTSGGLAESLKDFLHGFGTRTGLAMTADIAPGVGKIDDAAALHLFRVCQEALTNVYRHAAAHAVQVTLEVGSSVRLTVKDDGVGFKISGDIAPGLGLRGMHERMAQLGGAIDISSDPAGTTLVATVPLGSSTAS